jgi:hypothetical protein
MLFNAGNRKAVIKMNVIALLLPAVARQVKQNVDLVAFVKHPLSIRWLFLITLGEGSPGW